MLRKIWMVPLVAFALWAASSRDAQAGHGGCYRGGYGHRAYYGGYAAYGGYGHYAPRGFYGPPRAPYAGYYRGPVYAPGWGYYGPSRGGVSFSIGF
jgi:hypothetical protein